MSKIYVAEFAGLGGTDQGDSVPILAIPATVEYTIIVSAASSGAAQAIQPTTKFVEISTDTTCSFVIGTSGGAALLTNCRLQTNERVIRRVPTTPQTGGPGSLQLVNSTLWLFTTANV
jgi:hypothetical protein